MNAVVAHLPEPSPAIEGLRARLKLNFEALLQLEPSVRIGDEPDHLRRFRVAGRRIRAQLRAARPLLEPSWSEPLRAELGWLGGELGPARDLDVLLAHVRGVSAQFEPGERFTLARAIGQLEQERDAARAALLVALESSRYSALVGRLERELSHPVTRPCGFTLAQIAAAEHRRLRKAYRALEGVATDSELHDLRLRVKRARYATELASDETGRPALRFVRCAKTVQDVLGEHQDAAVAEAHVRGLLGRPNSARFAVAAGRLIERQAVRREHARAAFPAAWAALEKAGKTAFG